MRHILAGFAMALAALVGTVQADEYPERPIMLMVSTAREAPRISWRASSR